MAKSVIISYQDMDDFLVKRGFSLIQSLPNTHELVYGRIVRPGICLRVYTSVVGESSRDNGEDAIRCVLVAKVGTEVKIIGSDRRVHRVEGWRNNLQDRLDHWPEQLGPDCPKCGKPTVRRRSRRGPFWGCSDYPNCRSVTPISPAPPPMGAAARLGREVLNLADVVDSD